MEMIESCVPPGFRFHPTEEELVGYYLKRKINSLKIDLDIIVDLDLYKIEPWDIQARCNLGYAEQNEWYFFSHKDRKYPTGTRTNRATTAGFWKATGRDKAVLSKNMMIGMRKTLVFYKGRAPNGRKSDWIMHEYRLQTSCHGPPQEEGWVVCRAFRKPIPTQRPAYEPWNHVFHPSNSNYGSTSNPTLNCTTNFNPYFSSIIPETNFLDNQLVELPQLDSPKNEYESEERRNTENEFVDWKNLDSLLASQATDQNNVASSGSYPILSSIPQDYELEANTHLLECFSDF